MGKSLKYTFPPFHPSLSKSMYKGPGLCLRRVTGLPPRIQTIPVVPKDERSNDWDALSSLSYRNVTREPCYVDGATTQSMDNTSRRNEGEEKMKDEESISTADRKCRREMQWFLWGQKGSQEWGRLFHCKANDDHRGRNTTKSRARKNSKGQAAMPKTTATNVFKVPGNQGLWRWLMCKACCIHQKNRIQNSNSHRKGMAMSAVTPASGR